MALAQRVHFGFNMPILYNARRHHKEAKNASTPATAIWILCYKSQISFA